MRFPGMSFDNFNRTIEVKASILFFNRKIDVCKAKLNGHAAI